MVVTLRPSTCACSRLNPAEGVRSALIFSTEAEKKGPSWMFSKMSYMCEGRQ